MKSTDQNVPAFSGLQADVDPFDTGISGPILLTNLLATRTGILQTRPGWLPVRFDGDGEE